MVNHSVTTIKNICPLHLCSVTNGSNGTQRINHFTYPDSRNRRSKCARPLRTAAGSDFQIAGLPGIWPKRCRSLAKRRTASPNKKEPFRQGYTGAHRQPKQPQHLPAHSGAVENTLFDIGGRSIKLFSNRKSGEAVISESAWADESPHRRM
jgi:hypothetical protein